MQAEKLLPNCKFIPRVLTRVRGATRVTILYGALFEEVPSVFPAKTLYSPSKTFEGVMIARGRSLYRAKTAPLLHRGDRQPPLQKSPSQHRFSARAKPSPQPQTPRRGAFYARGRAMHAFIKVDFVESSPQKTQCKQYVTPCFAFSVCRRCTLSTRRSRKSGSAWGENGKKRREIASRP